MRTSQLFLSALIVLVVGVSLVGPAEVRSAPCDGLGDTECEPARMRALYASPEKPASVHRVSFGKGGISATIKGESQGWENSYVMRLGKGQRLHLKHHERDCVGLEIRLPSGRVLHQSTSNADIKLELPEKGDYTIHTIGYLGAHGRNAYHFTVTVI